MLTETAAPDLCCLGLQVLTWALCSRAENYNNLRRPDDGVSAVAIGNPATAEFQVCRTTLLAGVLGCL